MTIVLTFVIAALALLPSKTLTAEEYTYCLADSVAIQVRCLEILRDSLKSKNFWVSIHAVEGLLDAGLSSELRPQLSVRLADEQDDQRRCGLARELIRAGDMAQSRVILSILDKSEPYAHLHAVESLYKVGVVGDRMMISNLIKNSPDPKTKLMAAAVLARSGDSQALRQLRSWIQNDQEEICSLAAWAIGRLGTKSDISSLQRKRDSIQNPVFRSYFDHALAALGDRAGLEKLCNNLSAGEPTIRTAAASFAKDIGDPCLLPSLHLMLNDSYEDARVRAAHALLQFQKVKCH